MIEVFKTNIEDHGEAKLLLDHIHQTFTDYTANFDLEDCDKILRVQCTTGKAISAPLLISFIKEKGHHAEVLPG